MIKKYLLLLYFASFSILCLAQPRISGLTYPKEVDVYDLYEIRFQLGAYDNPYDPEVIDVYAEFTGPNGQLRRVVGFYYEGYQFMKEKNYEVASRDGSSDGWRIRFTPDFPGKWTYVIHAVDRKGERQSAVMSFNCHSKKSAEGFIRKANSKYLKREAFINGKRGYQPFYPVGPNVAWYSSADYNKYKKPYGIYDYEYYIDALSGNANYMRVWICRYQYLSLYGPEHAGTMNGKPHMYFDASLNQKDAAELDHIVSYAAQNDINLMLCLFTFGDFRNDSEGVESSEKYGSMPSGWCYNPYHTVLGLEQPLAFFNNPKAMRVTRNLVRYCIARWGYATNIAFWELFNEVDNIFKGDEMNQEVKDAIINWHSEMAKVFSEQDPYHHLVTSSMCSLKGKEDLEKGVFKDLDFVQRHSYHNIQKAVFGEQVPQRLLDVSENMRETYPSKPVFIGEYGFGSNAQKITANQMDPYGFDLHNTLWSSLFSGSAGPASFWRWSYLNDKQLYGSFRPMLTFCKTLPLLSDSFTGKTTGESEGTALTFPNGLETYYLVNDSQDTLLGWAQDEAFAYQSLRRLTDEVGKNNHFVDNGVLDPEGYVYTLDPAKRPAPSSSSNRIVLPIENQARGTRYQVRWFDGETGQELTDEATTVTVKRPLFRSKRLVIEFPSSIRDLRKDRINNTFGDAVFIITKE